MVDGVSVAEPYTSPRTRKREHEKNEHGDQASQSDVLHDRALGRRRGLRRKLRLAVVGAGRRGRARERGPTIRAELRAVRIF